MWLYCVCVCGKIKSESFWLSPLSISLKTKEGEYGAPA